MAESPSQEPAKLRTPNRFITSYNDSGVGVFDTTIPELLPTEASGDLALHLGYATESFPANLTNQSDLNTYSSFLSTPPGIFLPGGTVLRIVDFKPGCETPMHRTVSLDYGVVLEGEIELVLDSGESRVLKKSDISIQRGTDHMWRNKSQTEWGRMMFVSQGAKPLEVNGKTLDYSYGMDR